MNKSSIRKDIKDKLSLLSPSVIKENSIIITNVVCQTDMYKKAQNVFLYNSFPKEVVTESIVEIIKKDGKTPLFPVVKGEDMIAVIPKNLILFKNIFGILEPSDYSIVKSDDIDLAIIPLVAFDEKCNRLGRGKGYYDKYLRNIKCKKIGLAFECQKVARLPIETHDVQLDLVITEENIYFRK